MAEVLTKEAEESMKRIVSLHKVRLEAAAELEDAEAEVKLCRRKLDKAQKMVNDAIQEESTPTLFSSGVSVNAGDLDAARKALLAEDAKPEAKPEVKAEPVSEADMKWRQVKVEDLDIPGKTAGFLKAHLHNGAPANLDTLGGLADWKAADRWFTDCKGVGKAAAEKIDNAIVKYFEQHPIVAAEPAKPTEQAGTMTPEVAATVPVAEVAPPGAPQPEVVAPAAEKKKRVRTKKAAPAAAAA